MSGRNDAELDLDRALDDFVAAYRDDESPSSARVEATWDEIAASADPAPGRRRIGPVGWAFGAAAAAVLLVFAWSQWRGSARPVDEADRSQTPYEGSVDPTEGEVRRARPKPLPAAEGADAAAARDLDASSEPVPTPAAEPSPAAAPEAPAASRPRAKPASAAAPAGPSPEPAVAAEPPPTALAEETRLIGRIRRALSDGRSSVALELVQEHAQRFAGGVFVSERELARARALCGLGRPDRAREVADAFVRTHPESHLVDSMNAVCR